DWLRRANHAPDEFTAYARVSRLTMGFAQLNPSYKETTERIQDSARPARIASLISAASGRCRWEFAARTSPLDIMSWPPAMSLTYPPASRTRRSPAAMSQGEVPNSQYPS